MRSGTFYSSLVTRCSLETFSLPNKKSIVTCCITYLLSLQNLLIIIQKLTRYHSETTTNLLVIIQNLLVTIQKHTRYHHKPTRYDSKPTRYHFKTYSLSPQDLLVIIEKLSQNPPEVFRDKLTNISRLRADPTPLSADRPIFFSRSEKNHFPQAGGGALEKFRQGCSCYFL